MEKTRPLPQPPAAVLFDKDGTLVVDVPYNGDPEQVHAMPGARELLDRLRAAGVPVAIITNQSGVGLGVIGPAQLLAVMDRTTELLGPFDAVMACPHSGDAGCRCRKPRPGMLLAACAQLGVDPAQTVMVGDIGADMAAAEAAGAAGILVPTTDTRDIERSSAAHVARDLGEVGELLCGSGAR